MSLIPVQLMLMGVLLQVGPDFAWGGWRGPGSPKFYGTGSGKSRGVFIATDFNKFTLVSEWEGTFLKFWIHHKILDALLPSLIPKRKMRNTIPIPSTSGTASFKIIMVAKELYIKLAWNIIENRHIATVHSPNEVSPTKSFCSRCLAVPFQKDRCGLSSVK